MTPRFYPVVKESRPVDAKVRRLSLGHFCVFTLLVSFPTISPAAWLVCCTSSNFPSVPADAQEEEDPAQFQPSHGVSRWLGDGFQRASLPNCVCQVTVAVTLNSWL